MKKGTEIFIIILLVMAALFLIGYYGEDRVQDSNPTTTISLLDLSCEEITQAYGITPKDC